MNDSKVIPFSSPPHSCVLPNWHLVSALQRRLHTSRLLPPRARRHMQLRYPPHSCFGLCYLTLVRRLLPPQCRVLKVTLRFISLRFAMFITAFLFRRRCPADASCNDLFTPVKCRSFTPIIRFESRISVSDPLLSSVTPLSTLLKATLACHWPARLA
jgi:hypothetical protein